MHAPMPEEAWGRWGPEDELGRLNLIGSEETRAALLDVRHGRVISLAQPISRATPVPSHRPPIQHFMNRDGGDYAAGARARHGVQLAEDTIILPLHSGTHIDCLCHVWYDDRLYNGFSGNDIRSNGARRCGAETLKPVVTRGVLIDFVALHGGPLLDGYAIGPDEFTAAREAMGIEIRPGDALLLRTGWLEAHLASGDADFDSEPGLSVEAAELIAETGAAIVGADNFAIEAIPFPPGTAFPVHQRLIRDHGIFLIEGLSLKALGETGVRTFLFIATALPIVGATASPLAPVAVI